MNKERVMTRREGGGARKDRWGTPPNLKWVSRVSRFIRVSRVGRVSRASLVSRVSRVRRIRRVTLV
jgi:hypothetical protein